jgi:hypothetical protein
MQLALLFMLFFGNYLGLSALPLLGGSTDFLETNLNTG